MGRGSYFPRVGCIAGFRAEIPEGALGSSWLTSRRCSAKSPPTKRCASFATLQTRPAELNGPTFDRRSKMKSWWEDSFRSSTSATPPRLIKDVNILAYPWHISKSVAQGYIHILHDVSNTFEYIIFENWNTTQAETEVTTPSPVRNGCTPCWRDKQITGGFRLSAICQSFLKLVQHESISYLTQFPAIFGTFGS